MGESFSPVKDGLRRCGGGWRGWNSVGIGRPALCYCNVHSCLIGVNDTYRMTIQTTSVRANEKRQESRSKHSYRSGCLQINTPRGMNDPSQGFGKSCLIKRNVIWESLTEFSVPIATSRHRTISCSQMHHFTRPIDMPSQKPVNVRLPACVSSRPHVDAYIVPSRNTSLAQSAW